MDLKQKGVESIERKISGKEKMVATSIVSGAESMVKEAKKEALETEFREIQKFHEEIKGRIADLLEEAIQVCPVECNRSQYPTIGAFTK